MSDFEYSVVLAGLRESEQVLLLPSTGLYQSQSTLRDWMRRPPADSPASVSPHIAPSCAS